MHEREVVRAQLKRKLECGLSIHMPAPRRIGKTWTVNRLASDLRNDGWQVVELDVEGVRTPAEFARNLCVRIEAQTSKKARFAAHLQQRITNLLGGGWGERPLDALGRVVPAEFAETLIASLNESDEKVAIIIDEIAYFFLALCTEDQREANAFAYKMRALQQRYKNVRWILTGSIGLDAIARRYDIQGAFVDFETFPLEPFTKHEARSFMRDNNVQRQITNTFDASDEDFDYVFAELGWLAPYYLKLIANEVRPSLPGNGKSPPIATRADFEDAFAKLLLPSRKSLFAVWGEHIRKNLPHSEQAVAECILNKLSEGIAGETESTLQAFVVHSVSNVMPRQLRDVLGILLNDGLIAKFDDRFTFRSGLVRRYWKEYEAK